MAARIRGGFYDSKFEERIGETIKDRGYDGRHNREKIYFIQPEKKRFYTPDFKLHNGIYIEAKGWWKQADRLMHKWIKEQHPELDIRFIFQYKNRKISKTSSTTYEMYCDKLGIKYAHGEIPNEWYEE